MSDMTQGPINGNYGAQHAFPDPFNPAHAAMNTAANFQPAQSSTPTSATPSTEHQQKNEISKDEVGWFFVEQYYTTMSRNPDKLHLFYSKRSQLVFGTEAESVPVAVGTKAISEKIKALDFQDCKVRVLNVDSQASFDNILVSVIGEISNKSEPSRKFCQTFVLAEQPNGYYVLNDIFRYLVEENEEHEVESVAEEAAPAVDEAPVAEPAPAAEEAQVTDEAAVAKVDEKLEEVNGEAEQPEQPAPKTNGAPAEDVEEAPVPVVEPEALKEEKPQTPEPSPAPEKEAPVEKKAAPAPAAPAVAPAPPVPAVPKTWANIASKVGAAKAAAAAAAPAAPAAPAPTPAAAAPKAAAPAPTDSAATTPRATVTPTPAAEKDAASADAGWQTAGADHKKTQPRAGEDQIVLGYMKNVTEKVDAGLLKQALARFGKLKYFDVNRPKNSAFVEFAEPSAYAAAVAANPHQIGTEQIVLEERRPRPNTYGNGYPARGGRGRGDRGGSQGRGGFQRDGRGGFAPRGGRGGNAAAKARNAAPAA